MATRTVRIHDETISKLRQLAKKTGRSIPDLLRDSVDLLERDRLLDEANAAFARQRADKSAWAAELREREEWDATLTDGLDEI